MATERQILANRKNAQKSTGPRTAEGKATSSKNALIHGLTTQASLLEWEDCEAYRALHQSVHDSFKPLDLVQRELSDYITNLLWRLRRARTYEACLVTFTAALQSEKFDQDPLDLSCVTNPCKRSASHQALCTSDNPRHRKLSRRDLSRAIADLLTNHDSLDTLSRYERHLSRQLRTTIAELAALRRNSLDKPTLKGTRDRPQDQSVRPGGS